MEHTCDSALVTEVLEIEKVKPNVEVAMDGWNPVKYDSQDDRSDYPIGTEVIGTTKD